MVAAVHALSMERGDTFAFRADFTGIAPESITGIFFTCKKRGTDSDANAIFQKSFDDGVWPIEDEPGSYWIRVAPADTREVAKGKYYYDLQFVINGRDVYTPIKGTLTLLQDVTGVSV